MRIASWGFVLFVLAVFVNHATAGDPAQGYRWLTEKAYLQPADFDEDVLSRVWREWPEPLRSQAEQATPEERRKMAFERYGFTPRPDSPLPLQYVVNEQGQWTMNCFACHGGKVMGQVVPGLPNSLFALQTLSEEIRDTKLKMQRPLSRMDYGATLFPLGTTRGTTNAVIFGVALMSQRDAELNVKPNLVVPEMLHHDLEPPPWWHFKKKSHIYIDGFVQKGHKGLMQFMLIRSNGPEKFRGWAADFEDVYAYLESLEAPRYPGMIDKPLAAQGEAVFQKQCAQCHGTYGENASYPERTILIEELQTDPTRLNSLSPAGRKVYGDSWFADFGQQDTHLDPGGYVAPPLDGVWASAPYLHNGSVPTLWHVLHPDERPTVWRRTSNDGYDHSRMGLQFEAYERLPEEVTHARERREYFETRRKGKQATGHNYPNRLTEDEKQAVLEYLKSL